MNKVLLTGRLTRDPEVRYVGDKQTPVAKFSLAVNRRFKKDGQPSADYINCTAMGKVAEFIEKYFHKGMKADIEGRWQTGSYDGKNGKVYTNDCFIENIEFGESKTAAGDNGNGNYQSVGGNSSNANQGSLPSDDGFMDVPDGLDGLPFN